MGVSSTGQHESCVQCFCVRLSELSLSINILMAIRRNQLSVSFLNLFTVMELLTVYVLQAILMERRRMRHRLLLKMSSSGNLCQERGMDSSLVR